MAVDTTSRRCVDEIIVQIFVRGSGCDRYPIAKAAHLGSSDLIPFETYNWSALWIFDVGNHSILVDVQVRPLHYMFSISLSGVNIILM